MLLWPAHKHNKDRGNADEAQGHDPNDGNHENGGHFKSDGHYRGTGEENGVFAARLPFSPARDRGSVHECV